MRAITMSGFGVDAGPAEHPTPSPAPGQVLVRVHASSVNGFDVSVAAGYLQGMMEHRFPVVLGKDFAGTVEAVGDGVSRFGVGDRVFGVVMQPFLGDGGFAEYVAVDAHGPITAVPDGLDLTTAGALGLAGAAAHDSVAAIAPVSGETVLISGATGGVGAIAVQLAAAVGATVIATATPGEEASFVTGFGATHTVDYTGDLAAQVRAIAPDGVDAVLHLAGDGTALFALLVPGGRLASTLGFTPEQTNDLGVTVTTIMANPASSTLDALAVKAATAALQVPVTRTYPLHEVPQALADFRGGTLGKLAVNVAAGE
ncbi:MAG TPA: NADP-dependent oxidoreductase [Jiangellaceae bacterium]|nr:NADP-dependent oxidoreductase [Jiangellaceae bacterium]